MALQYCQVCGVLVPNAPAGVDATICEKCFASRKVIIADDESSAGARGGGQRVQFQCPTCQSLLQLAPVKKRTKIKCPRCTVDFYMFPDGRIETSTSSVGVPAASPTTGAQSKLLEDLKPISDLNQLLANVPEKKGSALPSVLDSDRYAPFANTGSSQNEAAPIPGVAIERLPTPAPRRPGFATPKPPPPPPRLPGESSSNDELAYELLPDESNEKDGGVAFAKDVIETKGAALPPPRKAKDPSNPKITTARRTRDAIEKARLEREQRDVRAAEAQRHTLALLERNRKRSLKVATLVAIVLLPLAIAGVFLASTTAGTGFATKNNALGARLNDLGELARRGVQGFEALATGK